MSAAAYKDTRVLDVSYSQILRNKHSFVDLVNSGTSQFMFRKYWKEFQNVKPDSEITI